MLQVLDSGPASLALQVPATRAALEPARQAMLAWLQPLHASGALVYRAELVLEEVLMNIVWHAYPGDAPGRARVSFDWDPGRLVLTFEDEGRPFDPTAAAEAARPATLAEAAPGGLGIGMLRRFSRSMRYERRDGRNRLAIELAA